MDCSLLSLSLSLLSSTTVLLFLCIFCAREWKHVSQCLTLTRTLSLFPLPLKYIPYNMISFICITLGGVSSHGIFNSFVIIFIVIQMFENLVLTQTFSILHCVSQNCTSLCDAMSHDHDFF